MNGTIFGDQYRYDPDVFLNELYMGNEFMWPRIPDITWAQRLGVNQIRAMGLAGSVVVDLNYTMDNYINPGVQGRAVAELSLPSGYFGSVNPPLLFCYPQYGTLVYHMQINDTNQGMGSLVKDAFGNIPKVKPVFQTYIQNLRYTADGTRWLFEIAHDIAMPISRTTSLALNPYALARNQLAYDWKKPYRSMKYCFFPSVNLFNTGVYASNKMSIVLHWYAMGVDPNL